MSLICYLSVYIVSLITKRLQIFANRTCNYEYKYLLKFKHEYLKHYKKHRKILDIFLNKPTRSLCSLRLKLDLASSSKKTIVLPTGRLFARISLS